MREGVGVIEGSVDEVIQSDFPGLGLLSIHCDLPGRKWRSKNVEAHIAELDDRVRGIAIGNLRNDSIAGNYRALGRQLGLDPDIERNPLDEAAVQRLLSGRFKAKTAIDQATLVGMLETGIPLWSLDAEAVHGWLKITVDDEQSIWVGDEARMLAPLLGQADAKLRPAKDSQRAVVFALRVPGVAPTTIEEAFWHVRSCLSEEE